MTFFIGFALCSCKVEDVVFIESDASDADTEAGNEAGSDSETAMLDSGSNISESGLNDRDGSIPSPEGGIDIKNLFQLPAFECPNDEAEPIDVCTIEMSDDFRAFIYSRYNRYYVLVDSEEYCSRPVISGVAEDIETAPEDLSPRLPCQRLCEALTIEGIEDIPKFIETISLVNYYYIDPNDKNILLACPLTCEMLRCRDAIFLQLSQLRPSWLQ